MTGHLSICQDKGVDRPRNAKPRMVNAAGKAIHQMTGISGFSEAMVVSERSCVSIRKDMPLDLACVLGCAVLTGFGAVAHTAKITPGSTVAVLGCGGVGLMIVNAARIAGAGRIIAIDRVPAKLALARAMGTSDMVEAKGDDTAAEVIALSGGGVHFSFEAIGLKNTVETAFKMLRPRGTCIVVGAAAIGTEFSIPAKDLLHERKLQGCYMGSNHFPLDIPRLIDFYMDGRLHLDALVSRRLRLEEIGEAFLAMKSGEAARSVITFPDPVMT
jgi:S-(hydroxymethyl)glutathione dehydrogenase/alcohol dehydrogenase